MAIPRIDPSQIGILLIDVQPVFLDYAFLDQDEKQESLLVIGSNRCLDVRMARA